MQSSQLPLFMQEVAAVCQIIAGLGTLALLYLTVVMGLRSKRADILMECHRRFSEVDAKKSQATDATEWYKDFWSRQFDQFGYWQAGFVDDMTFEYWMRNRHSEYNQNLMLVDKSYQEGWKSIKGEWLSSDFMSFMEGVFYNGAEKAIESYRHRSLQSWLVRRLGGKM